MKIFQDEQQTLEMVRVGMCQDDGIDPADPLVPEEWRQYIFADIKGFVKKAAAVHKHPLPAGKADQNRAPLTHIHGSQGKLSLLLPLEIDPSSVNDKKKDQTEPESLCTETSLFSVFHVLPCSVQPVQPETGRDQEEIKGPDFKKRGCGDKDR